MYDWLPSGEGQKVWSLLMSIGRLHPLNANEHAEQNDKLVIVIPGNPGHCQFYQTFASRLHEHDPTTITVWVLSHVGHVKVPPELRSRIGDTTEFESDYLQMQVKHKMDFLQRYTPKRPLANITLIGHSIGCYIILEILDGLIGHGINVSKAYLLFPTLERMRQTPNGQFMLQLRNYGLNRVLDTIVPYLGLILPHDAKLKIINWRCQRHRNSTGGKSVKADENVVQAAVDLSYGDVARQAMRMGYDELENVNELNATALDNHSQKLFLVYAAKDDWSPLAYRDELIKKWPMVKNVILDNERVEHAFVIFDNRIVADLVLKHL